MTGRGWRPVSPEMAGEMADARERERGRVAACRSCGEEIEWATSIRGKPIPVNLGTSPDGNLVVVNGVARKRTADDDRLHREPRVAHFATCPHAPAWRKDAP